MLEVCVSVCITLTVPLLVQPTQQVMALRSWGFNLAVLFRSLTVVPRAISATLFRARLVVVAWLACCLRAVLTRRVQASNTRKEETACQFQRGVSFITVSR